MSEYWDSLRDWGQSAWNNAGGDSTKLGAAPEGYADWGAASQAYQTATGNDWMTGKSLSGEAEVQQPAVSARKGWNNYKTPDMKISNTLQDYIGQDSPLMASAELGAKRNTKAQGLLNTQGAVSSAQNNLYNASVPMAMQDTQNAVNIGLAKMNDDLQRDLTSASIGSAERIAAANSFADMTNTMLSAMGRIMSTPDATWTQTMQDDFESAINASKTWISGMFKIPLG